MSEPKPEYVTDALEMMGAGYESAVEIESPRTVIQRRNGRNQEIERAAFVKISTAFKPEMKDIDEIALKVWLYIALSVNRNSGKAHPGLRTIAKECSFAVNTVRSAIDRLENKYCLLTVYRNEKAYNIYEPVEFVSAKKETVSPDDTDESQTVSAKRQSVSPRMILNQSNQNNINQNGKDLVDGILELAQMPGVKKSIRLDAIASQIKVRFGIEPTRRTWLDFMHHADKRQQEHGESLTVFFDWLEGQKNFDVSYWPPLKMQENWPRAFMVRRAEADEGFIFAPEEPAGKYVPAPTKWRPSP